MLSIGTVVLGVTDFRRALNSWMSALHYVPRDELEEAWAVLVPAEGTGTHLALDSSETIPQSTRACIWTATHGMLPSRPRRSSGSWRWGPSGSTGTCTRTTPISVSYTHLRAHETD